MLFLRRSSWIEVLRYDTAAGSHSNWAHRYTAQSTVNLFHVYFADIACSTTAYEPQNQCLERHLGLLDDMQVVKFSCKIDQLLQLDPVLSVGIPLQPSSPGLERHVWNQSCQHRS